jgi:hypothetical protein
MLSTEEEEASGRIIIRFLMTDYLDNDEPDDGEPDTSSSAPQNLSKWMFLRANTNLGTRCSTTKSVL